MKSNIAKLGPELMLAAAAVGVSHLVHATRAGAGFGLSLVWMVILISVLKYPAFRFAVDYASQTERSLIHAYSRLGRLALAWLAIAIAVDFFVATTAVALVTAGLFISVFDLTYSGPQVAIALCLVTAAILFQTDRVAPVSAGEFATELLSIFTSAIGSWSYPLIVIAAIAVMWSGVLALMDVLPRVSSRLVAHVAGRAESKTYRYSTFLIAQFLGVTLILLFLMRNFGTFIDFATGAGFISAPALAYYNYRAVTSADIASRYQPTLSLLVWHWIGFAAMTLFALAFLIQRVS